MLTRIEVLVVVTLVSLVAVFIGTPDREARVTLIEADHLRETMEPHTTVVILNWSRFDNVKRITSTVCEHLLQDTVTSVLVWNNNPQLLSYEDFLNTTCPEKSLKIVNSPENLYFEARYIACAQADTKYCFIQDDDYLVLPEIIRILALRMDDKSSKSNSIHLQPPDEMLSSQLRTIMIDDLVHATFAWLGYGTMIKRSSAVDFLALLDKFQLSDEEHKMADNYFTILSNVIPERWFDPGIPLEGGQPFTAGAEGEQRNNRHIIRATELLNFVLELKSQSSLELPYAHLPPPSDTDKEISRAPCQNGLCLVETSIRLLPECLEMLSIRAVTEMLEVEKRRLEQLGEIRKMHYLQFPPSNIVDGHYETAFRGAEHAKADDWIMLDLVRPFSFLHSGTLVLVVGLATETILRNAIFEVSRDGKFWDICVSALECSDVSDPKFESRVPLRMCRNSCADGARRFYRVRLLEDVQQMWVVHEMFVK